MGITNYTIDFLQRQQIRRRNAMQTPLGEFYRNGGNAQLYDAPVEHGDVVLDGGGYEGEWSAGMMVRYGCKVELFEAIPDYARSCAERFAKNPLIRVHPSALGGVARKTRFAVSTTSSSEHLEADAGSVDVDVVDISHFLDDLGVRDVACGKLNIEGGEYEVLERLIESGHVSTFRSLFIQFHRQPEGWQARSRAIGQALSDTHTQVWRYPMVWEKWVRKDAV